MKQTELHYVILKSNQSWIILCMHPTNERWSYNVTLSVIGWAHTKLSLIIAVLWESPLIIFFLTTPNCVMALHNNHKYNHLIELHSMKSSNHCNVFDTNCLAIMSDLKHYSTAGVIMRTSFLHGKQSVLSLFFEMMKSHKWKWNCCCWPILWTLLFNHDCLTMKCLIVLSNHWIICTFAINAWSSEYGGSWNPSSWKTRTYVY